MELCPILHRRGDLEKRLRHMTRIPPNGAGEGHATFLNPLKHKGSAKEYGDFRADTQVTRSKFIVRIGRIGSSTARQAIAIARDIAGDAHGRGTNAAARARPTQADYPLLSKSI